MKEIFTKMQKADTKNAIKQTAGILFFAAAAFALVMYFSNLGKYSNRDFLLVLAFVILSGLASRFIPKDISVTALYRVWLVLFIEFFIRATVYGRSDFFEYTILEADSRRIAFYFENKVNLEPLKSIGQILNLPFRDIFTNIFGNIGLLSPVSFLFPLAFPNVKSRFLAPLFAGVALSLLVECAQIFFMCGAFDVDDILLNSCGAFLGAICAFLLNKFLTAKSSATSV